MSTDKRPGRQSGRPPAITLAASQVGRLEALAEAGARHLPELADRLLDEITRARIVPDAELPCDVVALGRRVTYRDEGTGRETTVTLVFPEDADISKQRASVMTPVGVALIGLREASSFSWKAADGRIRQLTVASVAEAID